MAKSFQTNTDWTTTMVTMIGFSSGNTTRKNRLSGPAPSMMAASSSSLGMPAMNAWNSSTQNASA